jgi:broad specificity phosphatase PhoE
MKPRRIILVRHGQSEGNADQMAYSRTQDYKLNLTETGREEARNAGIKISNVIGEEGLYVYISPYFRTRQTYDEISKSVSHNVTQTTEDPRLREQDWGHLRHPYESKLIENERDEYGTFYYRIPSGESGADVYDRVSTFFETIHRDFSKPDFPENVLIVTHGLTLRLFLMRWLHWSVEMFESAASPANCQIVIMEKQEDERFHLVSELKRK